MNTFTFAAALASFKGLAVLVVQRSDDDGSI